MEQTKSLNLTGGPVWRLERRSGTGLGFRSADDGDVTGTGCGEEGSDGVREEDDGEVLSDGEVDGDSGGDRRRGEGGDDGGSGEGEGGWAVSGFG